jgi:sugar phosphate permease
MSTGVIKSLNATSASASGPARPEAIEDDSGWYKWLVLLLLTLAYVLSMLDRYLPFILAESLKADLKLSDTQLGMLGGVLFAATYSLVGVPIARMADI